MDSPLVVGSLLPLMVRDSFMSNTSVHPSTVSFSLPSVENYPGFPNGVRGPEMMDKFRAQSLKFGTSIITETISRIDLSQRPFRYWREGEEQEPETCDALIIATGASAKRLNLPGEGTY